MASYQTYIKIPPMPKKRPIVTRNGTYMPPEYVQWKEDVGWLMLAAAKGVRFSGRVAMGFVFDKEGFLLRVEDDDNDRFGRADLDNLMGAVMDAAQNCGLIRDDIDVVTIEGGFQWQEEH